MQEIKNITSESSIAQGPGVRITRSNSKEDLEQHARNGAPWAAYLLGLRYLEGWVIPKDLASAFAWLRVAADAGHKEAALAVGELYRSGKGTEKNIWMAVVFWSRSLPLDMQTAGTLATDEFLLKSGASFDSSTSLRTESIHEVLKSISAYYVRDDIFPEPRSRISRELSYWGLKAGRKCLTLLLHHGDWDAAYNLAILCLEGKGAPKNVNKGLGLLEQAAAHGHHYATTTLAAAYICGLFGIQRNPQKGRALLSQAFKQAGELETA